MGSRMVHKEKTLLIDSDGSDYDDDEALLLKDDNFYPVKGQPGLFYRVSYPNRCNRKCMFCYMLKATTAIIGL